MNLPNILLIFIASIASFAVCMQTDNAKGTQLPIVQEITVEQRIATFRAWRATQPPVTRGGVELDSPLGISCYIHLEMFLRTPEEKAKSPEYIAQATQLAKALCPSYAFWDEYYLAFSQTKRGKCYSNEEQVELALAPKMQEIDRLKIKIAFLKGERQGESIDDFDYLFGDIFDWKKETEIMKSQMQKGDDWNLLSVIKRGIPAKQAEIDRLNQEVNRLSQPAILQQTLTAKVAELAQARDQLANLRAEASSKQRSLQTKTTELNQLQEHAARAAQNLAQLQESQNRIKSMLALFSASNAPGWESTFIESLKQELGK